MSIILPAELPTRNTLIRENVRVVEAPSVSSKIIQPLQIAILNLMPDKTVTEAQLLRLLGSTPLPVEVTLVRVTTHKSKHTSEEYLDQHYRTFQQIKNHRFDGLIVTGAPVEHLPFEQVDYWQELVDILDWAQVNVRSTFYICWAAQAALYHLFDIPKYHLPAKQFGVFPHRVANFGALLVQGFDDVVYAPHSRHTEIRREDIERVPHLEILLESDQAGIYIVSSSDGRQVFVTGHAEYDPLTLQAEYERDRAAGIPISIPTNYYPNGDPTQPPSVSWRSHAHLLFANWLHYCVHSEESL